MRDPLITKAYDRIAPDQKAADRMLSNIHEAMSRPSAAQARRPALRLILPVAAVVALLALLSTAGYAAYRSGRWHLPKPERYALDPENGLVSVHETRRYDAPPAEGDRVEPLSDEDFMKKAVDFLQTAGFPETELRDLTVSRQKNLFWDREEVEVYFDREGIQTSVKFDSESGYLLGFSGIDWVANGTSACSTQAEADALARQYYESLPVAQGYVMTGCEKYDEQYWTYDFCREVEPGIYNQYEMARISINPVSGQLVGCTVFYVPLLDDHEPGQERISQAEAEQAAWSCPYANLEGYSLRSAEVVIGLPNWNFTEYGGGPNLQASGVTRWAWALTYERPNSEYADQIHLLVDCYTGEILGGDVTG